MLKLFWLIRSEYLSWTQLSLHYIFFLKLIVTCILCVIYVREDNDSNVLVMIIRLVWTTWTPMSAVPHHSLTYIVRGKLILLTYRTPAIFNQTPQLHA